MKRLLWFWGSATICFSLAVGMVGVTGCEDADGLRSLPLIPTNATMTVSELTQVFQVPGITNSPLALPLSWSVTDRSLGGVILTSVGAAIYQRTSATGLNILMVRDQHGNEGFATIRQLGIAGTYSIVLSSSEGSPIKTGAGTVISIDPTAAGPTAPFRWEIIAGPGVLSPSGVTQSRSVGFTSGTAGVAIIQVTDANGSQGAIAITVEEEDDGGGAEDPGGAGGA